MNRTSPGSSGNHSSPGSTLKPSGASPLLSKALIGFTNAKLAEGLSPRTVASYIEYLIKRIERIGDRDIGKITGQERTSYLAWLRTEYQPHRFGGKTHPLPS
jgi:hypothetical protein